MQPASVLYGCQAQMEGSVSIVILQPLASPTWLIDSQADDELAPLKVKRTNRLKKPRRYFLPGLILCIILRLEIFHRVSLDLQCSTPGIEVRLKSPARRAMYSLIIVSGFFAFTYSLIRTSPRP
jgi:hypothetical protein